MVPTKSGEIVEELEDTASDTDTDTGADHETARSISANKLTKVKSVVVSPIPQLLKFVKIFVSHKMTKIFYTKIFFISKNIICGAFILYERK